MQENTKQTRRELITRNNTKIVVLTFGRMKESHQIYSESAKVKTLVLIQG